MPRDLQWLQVSLCLQSPLTSGWGVNSLFAGEEAAASCPKGQSLGCLFLGADLNAAPLSSANGIPDYSPRWYWCLLCVLSALLQGAVSSTQLLFGEASVLTQASMENHLLT